MTKKRRLLKRIEGIQKYLRLDLFPLFGSSLDAVIPRHSMISRVRFQLREADSDGSLRGWIGDNHRFWDGL